MIASGGHTLGGMPHLLGGPAPPAVGAIVIGRFPLAAGEWIRPHHHPQHQLAWARRGVLSVAVGDRYWVLPPTRALWLPAGVVHRAWTPQQQVVRSTLAELAGECAARGIGNPSVIVIGDVVDVLPDAAIIDRTTQHATTEETGETDE